MEVVEENCDFVLNENFIVNHEGTNICIYPHIKEKCNDNLVNFKIVNYEGVFYVGCNVCINKKCSHNVSFLPHCNYCFQIYGLNLTSLFCKHDIGEDACCIKCGKKIDPMIDLMYLLPNYCCEQFSRLNTREGLINVFFVPAETPSKLITVRYDFLEYICNLYHNFLYCDENFVDNDKHDKLFWNDFVSKVSTMRSQIVNENEDNKLEKFILSIISKAFMMIKSYNVTSPFGIVRCNGKKYANYVMGTTKFGDQNIKKCDCPNVVCKKCVSQMFYALNEQILLYRQQNGNNYFALDLCFSLINCCILLEDFQPYNPDKLRNCINCVLYIIERTMIGMYEKNLNAKLEKNVDYIKVGLNRAYNYSKIKQSKLSQFRNCVQNAKDVPIENMGSEEFKNLTEERQLEEMEMEQDMNIISHVLELLENKHSRVFLKDVYDVIHRNSANTVTDISVIKPFCDDWYMRIIFDNMHDYNMFKLILQEFSGCFDINTESYGSKGKHKKEAVEKCKAVFIVYRKILNVINENKNGDRALTVEALKYIYSKISNEEFSRGINPLTTLFQNAQQA